MDNDQQGCIDEIDNLFLVYSQLKCLFACPSGRLDGKNCLYLPNDSFYRNYNDLIFGGLWFEKNLTDKDVEVLRFLTTWINQNFIIRLYGCLELYGFVGNKVKINQEIKGWKYVDILRRMRQKFGHTPKGFIENNKENEKLIKEICNLFGLNKGDYTNEIPLDVNRVIEPLVEKTEVYVKNYVVCKINRMVLNLQRKYFEFIKDGSKIYEGRLGKEKYRLLEIGEMITFESEGEEIQREVKSIHVFGNFREVFKMIDFKLAVPDVGNIDEAVKVYEQFYSKEEQKMFGVVMIEIE